MLYCTATDLSSILMKPLYNIAGKKDSPILTFGNLTGSGKYGMG